MQIITVVVHVFMLFFPLRILEEHEHKKLKKETAINITINDVSRKWSCMPFSKISLPSKLRRLKVNKIKFSHQQPTIITQPSWSKVSQLDLFFL